MTERKYTNWPLLNKLVEELSKDGMQLVIKDTDIVYTDKKIIQGEVINDQKELEA